MHAGELTYEEVRGALHRLGIDMTDLNFVQFIQRVDQDQDGSVDVQELENAVMNDTSAKDNTAAMNEAALRPEKVIWEKVFAFLKTKGIKPTTLFHDIDDDNSGIIGPEELRNGLLKFVGIALTDQEFELALKIVDRDGSGEIEYNELSRAIKYGDPTRKDNRKHLLLDMGAEQIAKQMYGRYSLVQRAKTKKNQWDLLFDEVERGVVQVEPRKPNPLFSPKVEHDKSYVGAMNVPRPRPPPSRTVRRGTGVGVDEQHRGRCLVDPNTKNNNGALRAAGQQHPETPSFSPRRPTQPRSTTTHTKNPTKKPTKKTTKKTTKKPTKLVSDKEALVQQREEWISMSMIDRGGLTRKKYSLEQRLLALNPNPSKKFQDKKKYGKDNVDGKPTRGDPGGIVATMKAKQLAKQLMENKTLALKEKGSKAKGRWGKLKFASKFMRPGRTVVVVGDNEVTTSIIADTRPEVDGVKLDHPSRVAAFVEGQINMGKSRKDALEALRKLTPNAHATTKNTAFFTAADALVARAGIMSEIIDDEEVDRLKHGHNAVDRLPAELQHMSMAEEAVVERALISIARYIHDKRARVVDVFRSMDHDGGGTLDREELEWGLKKFGCELKGDELDMVVSVFDSDGGGTIDFKEFAAAIKFAHRLLVKELNRQKNIRSKDNKAKRRLKEAKLKLMKEAEKEKRRIARRNVRFQIADQQKVA